MKSKYISSKGVERNLIALDIEYRVLKRPQIEMLLNEQSVKDSFIDRRFNKKRPQKEWSKDYLSELSCMAIAESFNEEYLYYLNDVAEYVYRAKLRRRIFWALAVIAVILIIVSLLQIFN